jgi:hypothetical protein
MKVEDGYEFFANQQLVTVFSAPNYCDRDDGKVDFPNAAAILCVDGALMCTFQILKPERYGGGEGAAAAAGAAAMPVEEEVERALQVQFGNLKQAQVQPFQLREYVTDAEFAVPPVPRPDEAAVKDFEALMESMFGAEDDGGQSAPPG